MARRLNAFPEDRRRYPWQEWTDGSVWEIRRGEDYDAPTENMRVNLHMKADALAMKVRTQKVRDDPGEGLVFQFLDPDGQEVKRMIEAAQPDDVEDAMSRLYQDAIQIYDRARAEVTIERSDGTRQKYAAVRFKQAVDKANAEGTLLVTIARIIRRPTLGLEHLAEAGRTDLMLENLVLDPDKPYHRFFTARTVDMARARMAEQEPPA